MKKEKSGSIQVIPPLDIEVEHCHLCLSQAGPLGIVHAGGVLQLNKGLNIKISLAFDIEDLVRKNLV